MQETEDKSDMFVQRACEIQNVKFERLKKVISLNHSIILWKLFGFWHFKDAFMLLPSNVDVTLDRAVHLLGRVVSRRSIKLKCISS